MAERCCTPPLPPQISDDNAEKLVLRLRIMTYEENKTGEDGDEGGVLHRWRGLWCAGHLLPGRGLGGVRHTAVSPTHPPTGRLAGW